jgi:hypothetical protein
MSTFAPIARSAFPAYQYVTPLNGDMIALGIQSPIHYNGLVLNDRLRPDRYHVTEIDGLGAPDIRVNSAPRPAEHGEIPYDSYWSGDTLVIDGTMQAGNLFELGRMERDLRAAFGTLVESPMKFSWWDIHDEFSDPLTSAAMWAAITQSATFPGDGTMRTVYSSSSLTNPAILYYALRQYVDHTITEKFTMAPTTNPGLTLPYGGIIAKCSSATSYVSLTASPTQLSLTAVVGGSNNGVSSALSLSAGQQYWLRLQSIADTITGSIYQTDPSLNLLALPLATIVLTLAGTFAQQFGYLQGGFAGVFVGGQNATQIAIQDFRVDAIWPCDMVTNVRPIASPVIKNIAQPVANATRFKRDFQLTVRASNPRLTQPTKQTLSTAALTPASSTVSLGRIYPRTYPLKYIVPVNSMGQPASQSVSSVPNVECINRGTWLAQPIITIFGGVSIPVLLLLPINQFIQLDGAIAMGDFIVIDVAKHTLVNSSGNNVFGLWDPSSTWLEFPPGPSRLLFFGQKIVGSPKVSVAWANTWK